MLRGAGMNRPGMLVLVAVAAFAIVAAGFAGAPKASAASKLSCAAAMAFSVAYNIAAEVNENAGNRQLAAYYRGKADGLVSASC
jgi:hypothetical protein